MLIGELAAELGVTTKTIRHYERVGLIPPARRAASGYRTFDGAAVQSARLVVGLRGLGLPLETVRELVDSRSEGTLRKRLLAQLDREIQELALQISVLQGRHDDLEARYRALLGAAGRDECVCAATLQLCDCAAERPQSPADRGDQTGRKALDLALGARSTVKAG